MEKIEKKLDVNSFYETQGFAVGDHNYNEENRFKKITSIIFNFSKNKKDDLELLDLGCGDGSYIDFLSKKYNGMRFTGSDVSNKIVDLNREKSEYSHFNFFAHDFNKVLFSEKKYDIIIAGELIEHLENTDNFFISIKNILKDDGILIITTPNLASWLDRCMLLIGWQPFSTEVSYVSRTFGRKRFYKLFGISDSVTVGHLRLFTPKALTDLAEFYGFKKIKHIPYYQQKKIINIFISNHFKNLAEGMIIIFTK